MNLAEFLKYKNQIDDYERNDLYALESHAFLIRQSIKTSMNRAAQQPTGNVADKTLSELFQADRKRLWVEWAMVMSQSIIRFR